MIYKALDDSLDDIRKSWRIYEVLGAYTKFWTHTRRMVDPIMTNRYYDELEACDDTSPIAIDHLRWNANIFGGVGVANRKLKAFSEAFRHTIVTYYQKWYLHYMTQTSHCDVVDAVRLFDGRRLLRDFWQTQTFDRQIFFDGRIILTDAYLLTDATFEGFSLCSTPLLRSTNMASFLGYSIDLCTTRMSDIWTDRPLSLCDTALLSRCPPLSWRDAN